MEDKQEETSQTPLTITAGISHDRIGLTKKMDTPRSERVFLTYLWLNLLRVSHRRLLQTFVHTIVVEQLAH
jgi:hypothetical protein